MWRRPSPGSVCRHWARRTPGRCRVEDGTAELDGDAVVDTLSDATGLPLHMLDPRSALNLDDVRAFLERRRPWPARCGRVPRRAHRAHQGRAHRPDPPAWRVPLRRPDRYRQDRARKEAGRVHLRLPGAPRAARHERVPDARQPRAAAVRPRASEPQAAPLIAAVRREPFSVVLLDEFEKAHANIWGVFLALFDDGRLTTGAAAPRTSGTAS